MADRYEHLSPELQAWLSQQYVFFVATAPLNAGGHVNCSPKGCDTFRMLNEGEVAYLDLTGSGIETIAHLQENGRIVLMFCAFEGAPRIVRLHGTGTVVYPSHPDFSELQDLFRAHVGARAIIRIAFRRISQSCGYGVPQLEFAGTRDTLDRWAERKGVTGLREYRKEKNHASLDGLSGYRGT